IGYVPKQFRRVRGVVMRKLRKEDYGKPESYRVINLLDVWGKVLERIGLLLYMDVKGGYRNGIIVKGETVQGSPLSPILFMIILGGVMEKVRKEEVEGMKIVAVVDDVDFMIGGGNRKE
ncbi:hypothetical protein C7212DRAFT_36831, partial [Tuber magnatum]